MNIIRVSIAMATAGLITLPLTSAASVAVVAPTSSVSGSWSGPLLGHIWTFEFSQDGENLTGRFKTSKVSKWTDLQSITSVKGVVQFSLESQPPSRFQLRMDPVGKAMTGSVRFGENASFPLTLTRNP